jgi:hypothetical protein
MGDRSFKLIATRHPTRDGHRSDCREVSIMRTVLRLMISAPALLALAAASPVWAQAPQPAALVEDVSAGMAGIGAFDYVSAGKRIELGSAGKLTLAYLASCVEETIAGGSVTVGAEQSAIAGGTVQRRTVACAGKTMQLTAEQSGKSGGLVFRKPPNTAPSAERPLMVPSPGPVISLPKAGRLTIARVDGTGVAIVLDLPGKPIDLATRGLGLAPGGAYRASYGTSTIVFQIDAPSGAPAPPIARLIRF